MPTAPLPGPSAAPTEKLALPSISSVHTRGPVDVPWYNQHSAQRSLYPSDRLPSLSLPQHPASPPIGTSVSRVGTSASATLPNGTAQYTPLTKADIPNGVVTPPPTDSSASLGSSAHSLGTPLAQESPYVNQQPSGQGYTYGSDPYGSNSMNQGQSYMDVAHSHLSNGQQHPPQTVTSNGMSHYSHYGPTPLLQPGPGSYSPAQNNYSHYGYANGVTSPQATGHPSSGSMIGSQVPSQLLPLPAMAPGGQPAPGQGNMGGAQGYQQHSFDTTGQIAPAGMKPKVTATLWEDEGSLCFQVEAKGVCVARREDNHMINGTKLLNVAGMTRGRRDGILKSEKMRHVVKIGPMHLKGVWIPFERALDFANKEKITELLYPLFVHNIGALLYHPTNQTRTHAVMAAAERRRVESSVQDMRNPQSSQPPSLHHHHSMQTPMGSHMSSSHSSMGPHPGMGARPGLDRAHTFPTPPTSAGIMGIGGSDGSYWSGQNMNSQGAQPLAIDTGLSNARSMPTTPATTPPGGPIQSMQQYSGAQDYSSRPLYSTAPTQQSQYVSHQNVTQQNMARFGQPMQSNPYMKNEMGPPSTRGPGSGGEPEQHGDPKGVDGIMPHGSGNDQVGHGTGEEEAEHEHDADYSQENGGAYSASRGTYTYNPGPAVGPLAGEHPHLSPEMTNSPNNQNHSGRVTPRAGTTSQTQWGGGYHTPPRSQPASSSLYNVMSSDRGGAVNGTSATDAYAAQPPLGYPSQQPLMNGNSSNKRVREIDDDGGRGSRPASRGPGSPGDVDGLKRRKTIREDSYPGAAGAMGGSVFDRDPSRNLNRTKSAIVQRRR
ncbi:MAG: hypothetical protein M1817_000648 [Caeruleum heppii]|nr:MAG: hypothetical protein M1817_000648 [Caeruleum heppii]